MALRKLQHSLLLSASTILPLISSETIYNPTWSGVMQNQGSGAPFNFMEATMVLPEISVPIYPPYANDLYGAAMWMGFDGWNQGDDTRLWQAGVRMRISQQADTSYAGWWEWYPALSYEPGNWDVRAGDHIYMNISWWDNGYTGYTSLTNLRTGQTIQHQQQAYDNLPSLGVTADLIFEEPTDSNWDVYALPSFSPATFYGNRACRTDGTCEQPGARGQQKVDIASNDYNYYYTQTSVHDDGSVCVEYVYDY